MMRRYTHVTALTECTQHAESGAMSLVRYRASVRLE